jgi:glycolate oxidase FAD binding subunit
MPTHTATSETDVVEAVQTAREWQSPLEIVAGGTKRNYGRAVVTMGTVLDVSGLTGITAYEPEELILTAAPGTPVAEIEAALAEKGQRLGFDPADWRALLDPEHDGFGTIGGTISADCSGPARVRYGAARDHLLGLRGVNGFGEAFKAGGKVVKNVTGFDIPKLVCGAMGTLCVLTELTLRVFPKPSLSSTLAVRGLSPEDGFAMLRRVWSSPLEATGLVFSKDTALIRLEGEKAPLAEKCSMLRGMLAEHSVVEIPDGDVAFKAVGDGGIFDDVPFDVWRLFLPPASAAAAAAELDSPLWLGDWAGGVLWAAALPGSDTIRPVAHKHGGYAVLTRAEEETRERLEVFEPQDAVRAEATRAVKAAFDPLHLFNPGRMWDGI